MPWAAEPALERRQGAAEDSDRAALSKAFGAIADTGTLVLASGAANPVTLTFMPEVHFVLLDAGTVWPDLATALSKAAGGRQPQDLPRTINLVSGASRTGDIGGRLVMGAHGPRRLIVLLSG